MYYENNEGVCLAIMKRALFIGRWQPLHPGHKWLFNQKLEKNIPIVIAVRDTPVDDSNPFSTEEVISNVEKEFELPLDDDGKHKLPEILKKYQFSRPR